MYYGFYYLGISEVSSIPLCVTELSSHVHDTIRMEEEEGWKERCCRRVRGCKPAESRMRVLAAIAVIKSSLLSHSWLRGYCSRELPRPLSVRYVALFSPAGVASMSVSAAAAVASKLVPLRMMLGLGLFQPPAALLGGNDPKDCAWDVACASSRSTNLGRHEARFLR